MTLTALATETVDNLLGPFWHTRHKQWRDAWRHIRADRFKAEEGILTYDWNCAMFLNNPNDEPWIDHDHLRHLLDTYGVNYQLAHDTYNDCYVLFSDLAV